MTTTFAQLGVPSYISDALERRGITEPFAIQAATIEDALAGRDVCGRAPTGSGKTLAFGIPMVATATRAEPHLPTALVLAPTRELAEQITTELRSFSGRLRVDAVYGGVGYGKQLSALRRGVDVLVACPGRLEDLIERGDVELSRVGIVVLDEADRMADMGFMPAVKRLLDQTSSDRQTVLFSATLDGDVAKLTRQYQTDPVRHEVGEETPDVRAATHRFYDVTRNDRNPVVADVVNGAWPSIVFTRTRHGADRLAKQLGKLGFEAAPIHGGRSQNQRNRALADFSKGRVHALVATDVAARGIHVDGVASVIHYDPPEDHKTYVHRSGRTARAGADGLVVSLVQPEQRKDYQKMQRQVGLDEPFMTASLSDSPVDIVPVKNPPRRDEAERSERSGQDRPNGGRRRQQRNSGSRRRDDRGAQGRKPKTSKPSGESRSDVSAKPNGRSRSDVSAKPNGRSRSDVSAKPNGQSRGDGARKQNGSKPHGAKQGNRSGKPSANNRKARRAHLQPKP
jgi:superfamily II DNA/RNA helicase